MFLGVCTYDFSSFFCIKNGKKTQASTKKESEIRRSLWCRKITFGFILTFSQKSYNTWGGFEALKHCAFFSFDSFFKKWRTLMIKATESPRDLSRFLNNGMLAAVQFLTTRKSSGRGKWLFSLHILFCLHIMMLFSVILYLVQNPSFRFFRDGLTLDRDIFNAAQPCGAAIW